LVRALNVTNEPSLPIEVSTRKLPNNNKLTYLLQFTVWKRIRPILEPTVLQCKQERLENERKDARSARRAIIHTSYKEFQKKLTPSQWKYLPRTFDICALDPFAKVLDAEPDVMVTAADFEDAFRQLPDLLLASSDAHKIHLRSLLKISTSVNHPASSAPGAGEVIHSEALSSSSSSPQPDPLDLATAVFTCREHCSAPAIFGHDDIAQHHCRLDFDKLENIGGLFSFWQHRIDGAPGPPTIDFSVERSRIAGAVVRAAGLDDRVGTVSDMDEKDLRFECSACRPGRYGGSSFTKVGYKWRDFVRCLQDFSFSFFFFGDNIISL
jgi:hypothetical protein